MKSSTFLSLHVWLVLVRIPVEIVIHLYICREISGCADLFVWKWSVWSSQPRSNWIPLQLKYASSQNHFGTSGEDHIVLNYLAVSLSDSYKCISVTADCFLSVSLLVIHLHCNLYQIRTPRPMDQWCWRWRLLLLVRQWVGVWMNEWVSEGKSSQRMLSVWKRYDGSSTRYDGSSHYCQWPINIE